jgi:mannose-6-phosphate isomerase-like protein (cupin superfamily)
MEIYKAEDFSRRQNLTPGKFNMSEILTGENDAKDLGALFVILPKGQKTPYVYHQRREQVIFFLAGEVIAIIEGKEVTLAAGDTLYTPAGEKHRLENRSNQDVRFLEFFTVPPWSADVIYVEQKG